MSAEDVDAKFFKFRNSYNANANNNNNKGKMNILDLPNEIIAKIFTYLDTKRLFTLEIVNSRFYAIVRQHLWRKVEIITPRGDFPTDGDVKPGNNIILYQETENVPYYLILFLRRASKLRVLRVALGENTYVFSAFPKIQYLQDLHVSNTSLGKKYLKVIADSCPLLKTVTFRSCFNTNLVSVGLTYFFKKLPNLESLDVSSNRYFDGNLLLHLSSELSSLHIGDCPMITKDVVDTITTHFPNLYFFYINRITDVRPIDINAWFKRIPNLLMLELSIMNYETDKYNYVDFSLLPNLQMLNHNFVPTSYDSIASLRNCKELRTMNVTYSGDVFGAKLFTNIPKLKSISFLDTIIDNVLPVLNSKIGIIGFMSCHIIDVELVGKAFHTSIGDKVFEFILSDSVYDKFFNFCNTLPRRPEGSKDLIAIFRNYEGNKKPKWFKYFYNNDRENFDNLKSAFITLYLSL